MTHYLRFEPVRFRRYLLATLFLFITIGTARAVNLVEEFYLPIPEWQVLPADKAITPSVTDTNFASITSILVTGDGTQIYYDQWEDGYETNLSLPTQSSTKIWGDGIDSNGIAPGFAHDPAGLTAGTVIILSNSVACSPRNPSQTYYDGRDRVAANKALVVTRAGWPSPTGPVFGGSAVVQATIDWGTNYVSPVGQDMTENLFKYTGFFVMASQNNTVVVIDPDGAGPLLAVTNTLNQGESYLYPGVKRGGTVNASKPVEVDLVCGDTVNSYAIDWFTLYPQSDWSPSYYTPLPSVYHGTTLYTTYMYFFNNSVTPITIFYTNLLATNNFILPANGGYKFTMPTNSGAVFTSAGGETYTTLSTVAGTPANDTDYNWGFTPLPKGSLTTEAFAGWSPGTADYSANGSPVWVTPTANTRVYVDYHGDHSGPLTDPNGGKYDTNYDLVALQSKTIYVPGTNDQTGLRIYTVDGTLLSTVWGEDPAVAGTGNPYLDLGNPVLPFPTPRLTKSSVIITDVAPAGLSVGDTLLYTVQVDNKGLLPLGNTVVLDGPPATLAYVSNSTSLNGVSIPDSTNGTAFPLDSPGYTIPIILSGGSSVFQYQAKVVASGSIINAASLNGYGIIVTNTASVSTPAPSFFISKTLLSPANGIGGVGQTMQFNLQIINNGNVSLTNCSVRDNYPSNKFSYVSASIAPNSISSGTLIWTNLGTLAVGADTNIIVSLLATNTASPATNFVIAASPGYTTNSGSVVFTNLAAPTPGITVNKTLVSPAGGKAGIGQTVQFNLQVYNSGYTTLTNLSLTDNFPGTNFSFTNSTILPNTRTTNSLVWTNLGSFPPGYITNIVVNFVVTNYSAAATNFATAASIGGATNTGSAGLSLTRSGLNINKFVLSPTNQPISIGSNIVFRIIVQNTGQNAVTNLPLEDTFSASYFQYQSATTAPGSIAPGDLLWNNLGMLLPGASITNDVTMKVTGGASPAYNTAAANFAVDTNGTAVSPASSTVGVNTAAGSISGKVYLDNDQSGTLTAGDTALQSVTLLLYTDPNGDGNPVDGILAQTVSSDANGYYEFLNLNIGNYIVVQTVFPGYTGSAPPLNRQAVVISSLTTMTNQNFFQYPTPSASYATVNGTVWNDVSGVGFYQAGDTGLTNVQVDLVSDLNSNGVVDAGETTVQTVFTATNGTYQFSAVAPGRYVVRETDLPGYISTGDTQGTNDNQIAVNLGSGAVTNGNDFFDFYFGLANTNNPPVAVPDFTNVLENFPLTITPLLNDNSPGGFALTITNVAATNGVASIIGGTNVLFTPALNFSGIATIGYTITNANGKSTSLISVTVSPVADLRISKVGPTNVYAASNFIYTISMTNAGPASASSLTVTDTLPNGINFVSASGGGVNGGGLVVWNFANLAAAQATNLTLTVTAPANGITLTNTASVASLTADTNLLNNISTPVVTTVTSVADLAIGKLGVASGVLNSNFNYTLLVTNFGPSIAANFLVTDSLPNGIIFVSAIPATTTNAANQVIWNLGTLASNATTNLTLTVKAVLRGNFTNIATVGGPAPDPNLTNNSSLPVVTSITNRPPIAQNDLAVTTENVRVTIPVLVNDSDLDGDALTIVSVSPTNGSASILGTNVMFTPTTNFIGTATIGYTITDGFGGTNSALVTVLVTNIPPVANPDIYFVGENFGTNSLTPLINDFVQTPGGTLGLVSATTTNGHMAVSGNLILYAPSTNFIGVVTIFYTITDNIGGTNTGVITVNVVNTPPVAQDDFASTPKNVAVTVPVLVNDFDNNYNPLTVVSVAPTNGFASISGTNVIFTPTNNFLGTALIGYTITDGNGGTNSATIHVTVTNRPPVAVNDFASASENVSELIPVLANDSDPDGDALTIISVAPTNGTANISGTNILFSPATNFVGTATIGYGITDSFGGTNFALVTISVTNLPPIANPDFYSVAENSTNIFSPLTNDLVQTPGGTLTILSVSPTNGTATISGTNLIFSPTTSFIGTATIGYTISDNIGGTNSSVITVSVTNQAPIAFPQTLATTENIALPITLAGSDPVGHPLTFAISSLASGGTLTGLNTNTGAVIYTPTNNFTGTDTFTFRVNNGINNSSNATVTIAVSPTADLLVQQFGPASGVAGSNLVFVVAVTNLGPASATNLLVTNQIDSGFNFVSASAGGNTNGNCVTWTLPVLPANGKTNFTVTLFAIEGGTFTNLASGISVTPDLNATNNNGSLTNAQVVTTVSALADVAVFKTGSTNVLAGGAANYFITTTNFGPSTASNVVVFDKLPAGATLQTASGNYSLSNNFIVWNAMNLPGGMATNFTVTLGAPASGLLTNIAFSISTTPDSDTNNNNGTSTNSIVQTAVSPIADLAIGKLGVASGVLNSNFNYTLLVTNFGPSIAANFLVTDSLPNGIIFVSAIPATTTNAANQVIWNLGTLASNATTNLTLTVKAVLRGNFTNIATVGGPAPDPNLTNNSSLPVVTSITNRPPIAGGQSVLLPFNTATNLTLIGSDADGDPLTFVIVSAPADGVLSLLNTNTGAVTYTPTNNFTGTDAFTFLVNDRTTNSATATVTISIGTATRADLAVFKTGPTNAVAGSNLVYQITITNLGPAIATNVLVQDQLPAGFTFVSASPTNVLVASNVVNWAAFKLAPHTKTNFTVTAISREGGTFTNFASATSDALDTNSVNNNGSATNSRVRTIISALADVQIFKTGGTNVAAGSVVNYTIIATNAGPSTATNVIVQDHLPSGSTFQSASGSYILSNNIVTWSPLVLTNGASVNFSIALTAPASGLFTNIASSTSTTPDPNSTNNSGALGKSRVATKIVLSADLIVFLFGPTNAVQGSNFVYSLIVSNAGPSVSSNIVVSDTLPLNFVFVSASGGGKNTNGVVTWPKVLSLNVGATTNYTITIRAPFTGLFTNFAAATSTTLDPNSTNNSGVAPASQTQTKVSVAQFNWVAGSPVFNPQTGLYEEIVVVTNTGNGTVAGFQMYVTILTTNVFLWNATGTNSGGTFVEYDLPLDPSNTVSLALEFYDPKRVAFTNTLRIVPIIPANNPNASTNGSVAVNNVFTDTRNNTTRFVIEFVSVPGSTYTIIYSDDMVNWKVATPSVKAVANVTQWYDDGPPKTESLPASVNSRFYRVIKNN